MFHDSVCTPPAEGTAAGMSVIDSTRSLLRRALRAQRRIAVAQALFWPTIFGLAIGSVVLLTRRRGIER